MYQSGYTEARTETPGYPNLPLPAVEPPQRPGGPVRPQPVGVVTASAPSLSLAHGRPGQRRPSQPSGNPQNSTLARRVESPVQYYSDQHNSVGAERGRMSPLINVIGGSAPASRPSSGIGTRPSDVLAIERSSNTRSSALSEHSISIPQSNSQIPTENHECARPSNAVEFPRTGISDSSSLPQGAVSSSSATPAHPLVSLSSKGDSVDRAGLSSMQRAFRIMRIKPPEASLPIPPQPNVGSEQQEPFQSSTAPLSQASIGRTFMAHAPVPGSVPTLPRPPTPTDQKEDSFPQLPAPPLRLAPPIPTSEHPPQPTPQLTKAQLRTPNQPLPTPPQPRPHVIDSMLPSMTANVGQGLGQARSFDFGTASASHSSHPSAPSSDLAMTSMSHSMLGCSSESHRVSDGSQDSVIQLHTSSFLWLHSPFTQYVCDPPQLQARVRLDSKTLQFTSAHGTMDADFDHVLRDEDSLETIVKPVLEPLLNEMSNSPINASLLVLQPYLAALTQPIASARTLKANYRNELGEQHSAGIRLVGPEAKVDSLDSVHYEEYAVETGAALLATLTKEVVERIFQKVSTLEQAHLTMSVCLTRRDGQAIDALTFAHEDGAGFGSSDEWGMSDERDGLSSVSTARKSPFVKRACHSLDDVINGLDEGLDALEGMLESSHSMSPPTEASIAEGPCTFVIIFYISSVIQRRRVVRSLSIVHPLFTPCVDSSMGLDWLPFITPPTNLSYLLVLPSDRQDGSSPHLATLPEKLALEMLFPILGSLNLLRELGSRRRKEFDSLYTSTLDSGSASHLIHMDLEKELAGPLPTPSSTPVHTPRSFHGQEHALHRRQASRALLGYTDETRPHRRVPSVNAAPSSFPQGVEHVESAGVEVESRTPHGASSSESKLPIRSEGSQTSAQSNQEAVIPHDLAPAPTGPMNSTSSNTLMSSQGGRGLSVRVDSLDTEVESEGFGELITPIPVQPPNPLSASTVTTSSTRAQIPKRVMDYINNFFRKETERAKAQFRAQQQQREQQER